MLNPIDDWRGDSFDNLLNLFGRLGKRPAVASCNLLGSIAHPHQQQREMRLKRLDDTCNFSNRSHQSVKDCLHRRRDLLFQPLERTLAKDRHQFGRDFIQQAPRPVLYKSREFVNWPYPLNLLAASSPADSRMLATLYCGCCLASFLLKGITTPLTHMSLDDGPALLLYDVCNLMRH